MTTETTANGLKLLRIAAFLALLGPAWLMVALQQPQRLGVAATLAVVLAVLLTVEGLAQLGAKWVTRSAWHLLWVEPVCGIAVGFIGGMAGSTVTGYAFEEPGRAALMSLVWGGFGGAAAGLAGGAATAIVSAVVQRR